jgi:preprotein translocase subunit SecF
MSLTRFNIDFLKFRPLGYTLSFLIFASFFGGAYYKYQQRGSVFLYNVDFTGGTQVMFDFEKPVSAENIAKAFKGVGFADASIREFSGTNKLLVRVKNEELSGNAGQQMHDARVVVDKMKGVLQQLMPDNKLTVLQTESVGPDVGRDLQRNSIFACILGILLMLCYIWYRFWSFAFGLGSVVSLIHDVVVVLSFVLWFDYEVSMTIIAAALFILGYSINDTIVIFSRIRERIHKRTAGESMEHVVNTSINETLRRTLLTSFATSLVVLALLIFGGGVLRTLSLALLVGIVFGTYSSIYIASPVMLWLYREEK